MKPEDALGLVPYFAPLRPEERLRIAGRMKTTRLDAGAALALDPANPLVVVVLRGRGRLERPGSGPVALFSGDSVGEAETLAGRGFAGSLVARGPLTLATLDRSEFNSVLDDFPAAGGPLAALLGGELSWRDDLLREIAIARGAGVDPQRLRAILARRRCRITRRRRSGGRLMRAVLQALLFEPARRPAFWVFAGAAIAFVLARTVVATIIRKNLQQHLFAFIATAAGHPIHVHHFNYGLTLVALTGLLLMIPSARRALRSLSFLFGFGVGLVVDEFSLFWNLDPDYYQPGSRLAVAVALGVLAQAVYFPSLWVGIARRVWARLFP